MAIITIRTNTQPAVLEIQVEVLLLDKVIVVPGLINPEQVQLEEEAIMVELRVRQEKVELVEPEV